MKKDFKINKTNQSMKVNEYDFKNFACLFNLDTFQLIFIKKVMKN